MSYCRITHQFLPASEMIKAIDENGDTILVSPEVEVFTCEYCGKKYVEYIGIETYNTESDGTVCQECYDEYFTTCDQCGSIFRYEETVSVNEGRFHLCSDCADNYTHRCDGCGECYYDDDMVHTDDDYWVCNDCRDRGRVELYYCDNCDSVYYYDDPVHYDEDNDIWYCDNCEDSYQRRYPQTIHNYNFKPYPLFLGTPNSENEYLGLEIEVEGDRSYAESFREEFGDTEDNEIYLKMDGSVAGFEIVTHPMTRDYIYEEFYPKLVKGMNFLKSHSFKGHNAGGIHIHVSERAIKDDMLRKLVCLMYPSSSKDYNKWLAITQRHNDKMERWSSMSCLETKSEKKDYFSSVGCSCYKPKTSESRYTAMNICAKTVEFRIFNSNLRPERIMKNIEVILALLDFSKTNKIPSLKNYLQFVEEHQDKYRYLFGFLLEKHIYQSKEQKEKTEVITRAVSEVLEQDLNAQDIQNILDNLNNRLTTNIDDNDEGGQLCA